MAETTAQAIELVPVESLVPHPENPRRGDVPAIAESIARNGWWGVVIVQRRKGSPDRVLAGAHRWQALASLQDDGITFTDDDGEPVHVTYDELRARFPGRMPPAGMIPVEPHEIDDVQARAMLLSDNRASDLSVYDDAALTALLRAAEADGDLAATLWTEDDLAERLALDDILNGTDPGTSRDVEPPDEFPDVTRPATEHECPKCGYVWSGALRVATEEPE